MGVVGDGVDGEVAPLQVYANAGAKLLGKVHGGVGEHHPRNLMLGI